MALKQLSSADFNASAVQVPLVGGVTGVLPEANGGTNQSTYTTGDIVYASAANTLAKRAIGTAGQVLTVVGGVPVWQSISVFSSYTFIRDSFTSQTGANITLTQTPDALIPLEVYRNGVLLYEGSGNDYTVSGTTVTFTTSLSAENVIVYYAYTSLAFWMSFTKEQFTNQSTSTITLAASPVSNTERVYKNGVQLLPGSGNDYTISGNTITFTTALSTDNVVVFYHNGAFSTSGTATRESSTSSGTTVTLSNTPNSQPVLVFKNGLVLLDSGNDYTLSGTTITFTTALSSDNVVVYYYY